MPVKPREDGAPYYFHPLKVAEHVLDYIPKPDLNLVLAAILHDTIEDTSLTLPLIKAYFNKEVAFLVDGLTNTDTDGLRGKKYEKEAIFKKLHEYGERVIMIKLCDRLHNMETLEGRSKAHNHRKAVETRDYYLPMAAELRLTQLEKALQAWIDRYGVKNT